MRWNYRKSQVGTDWAQLSSWQHDFWRTGDLRVCCDSQLVSGEFPNNLGSHLVCWFGYNLGLEYSVELGISTLRCPLSCLRTGSILSDPWIVLAGSHLRFEISRNALFSGCEVVCPRSIALDFAAGLGRREKLYLKRSNSTLLLLQACQFVSLWSLTICLLVAVSLYQDLCRKVNLSSVYLLIIFQHACNLLAFEPRESFENDFWCGRWMLEM